jgi:hypothetical protein
VHDVYQLSHIQLLKQFYPSFFNLANFLLISP